MPAEPTTAVIDRVVDGVAVLLVGDDEREVHLGADDLPDGAGEGTWLQVRTDGDEVVVMGLAPDAETGQATRIQRTVERLRATRRGGRFGR